MMREKTGKTGRRGRSAGLVVTFCALCFLAGQASALKFRMFPQLNQKECVSESVSERQWELVLESVEANFRNGDTVIRGRNATICRKLDDRECQQCLQ